LAVSFRRHIGEYDENHTVFKGFHRTDKVTVVFFAFKAVPFGSVGKRVDDFAVIRQSRGVFSDNFIGAVK
jgi:hypothetical protein